MHLFAEVQEALWLYICLKTHWATPGCSFLWTRFRSDAEVEMAPGPGCFCSNCLLIRVFFFSATTTRSFCLTTATWRSDRISWTVSGATRNADSASSSRSCFHRCVCRLLNTFPLVALDRVNILVRLFFLGRILFGDDYLTKAKTAERQIAQCQISRRRNGDAKSSHGVFSQHPPADFFSRRHHKAAQYSLILVCTSSHYLKKMCGLIDLFEEARYLNKTCTSSNHRKKEARAQSADSSKAYSKPKAFNSRALCFPTTRR